MCLTLLAFSWRRHLSDGGFAGCGERGWVDDGYYAIGQGCSRRKASSVLGAVPARGSGWIGGCPCRHGRGRRLLHPRHQGDRGRQLQPRRIERTTRSRRRASARHPRNAPRLWSAAASRGPGVHPRLDHRGALGCLHERLRARCRRGTRRRVGRTPRGRPRLRSRLPEHAHRLPRERWGADRHRDRGRRILLAALRSRRILQPR